MKDKRVYIINRMQLVDAGPPIGEYYMPWLAGIDDLMEGWKSGSDDDHWEPVYSDAKTQDIHDSAIVGIYTTDANHAILEADPDIERIDDI